jgi:outer membrane protein assembly factor BamB
LRLRHVVHRRTRVRDKACTSRGHLIAWAGGLADDDRGMTPSASYAIYWTRRCLATAIGVCVALAGPLAAADPPPVGWRHDGSGLYPSAEAPPAWSLKLTHNIRWRTPLSSWANSSPVVVGQQVFLTVEPSTLLAISTRNGQLLWQDEVSVLDAMEPSRAAHARALVAEAKAAETALQEVQREQRIVSRAVRKPGRGESRAANADRLIELEQRQSHLRETIARAERYWSRPRHDTLGNASATPVSDGRHVYVVYGTGVVASYTVKGERRWLRWLGEPHRPMRGNPYGHAACPLLVGGQLIVAMGSLHGLDPATGEVRWRAGIYDDFGTPVAVDVEGTPAVATPRGLVHRASDGVLLADTSANIVYVGPLASESHVYWVGSTTVAARDHLVAGATTTKDYGTMAMAVDVRDLDAGGGLVTPTWRVSLGQQAVYATPATDGELIYVVDRVGHLIILDARTGGETSRQEMATGVISASPVIAANFLYLFGEDGRTVIGRTGRRFSFHATCQTEGGRATPYASNGRLYIRSDTSLLSVGAP